eukprot:g1648.t1
MRKLDQEPSRRPSVVQLQRQSPAQTDPNAKDPEGKAKKTAKDYATRIVISGAASDSEGESHWHYATHAESTTRTEDRQYKFSAQRLSWLTKCTRFKFQKAKKSRAQPRCASGCTPSTHAVNDEDNAANGMPDEGSSAVRCGQLLPNVLPMVWGFGFGKAHRLSNNHKHKKSCSLGLQLASVRRCAIFAKRINLHAAASGMAGPLSSRVKLVPRAEK